MELKCFFLFLIFDSEFRFHDLRDDFMLIIHKKNWFNYVF